MRTLVILLSLSAVALACTPIQPVDRGASRTPPEEEKAVSLFPSDAAVLPDDAIAKILDAKVRLPQHIRLALIHIEHRSVGRFWGWGPYWTAIGPSAQQEVAAAVIGVLRTSPRIESADNLPTFLLPEKATVGHLREAAARFQADAVFVYRTDCQGYERTRFFQASQAKAFCSAEAALLDVRSGLVPFTTRSLDDFTVTEESSDASFLETVRKAELKAFTAALEDDAKALVGYLGK